MIGKAIVCAVVCLFLVQACLARPDNTATLKTETTGIRGSCADSIKQLAVAVTAVITSIVDFVFGIIYGVVDSLQCFVSGRFIDCQKEAFQRIIDSSRAAFSKAEDGIRAIGTNAVKTVRTCLGGQRMEYVEPVLLAFIDTYASSQ